jgi:hypothetical protein
MFTSAGKHFYLAGESATTALAFFNENAVFAAV